MDVDEIVEVISAGLCRGETLDACATCQRKLRAIEAVRAMGAVLAEARQVLGPPVPGARDEALRLAIRRLDALRAAEADR